MTGPSSETQLGGSPRENKSDLGLAFPRALLSTGCECEQGAIATQYSLA